MANCTQCGCDFPRAETEVWKRLCTPCWRKNKTPPIAANRDYLALKMQNIVLEQKLRAAEELARRKSMPPNMIARLIRLAHPDKHANSTAANEATAWLLAQRGAI